MPLCDNCHYGPWKSGNPVTEEQYLERLKSVGAIPSGEGVKRVCVGSPFRVPLPLMIELCCMDVQICAIKGVELSELRTQDEANVAINGARVAIYQEAGLPAIGES